MAFSIDAKTWRSPNFDDRPSGEDIWALVFHSCEGSPPGDEQQSSLPWLCKPSSGVSTGYYVTREGVIYRLVDDAKRAWHAGVSMLNGDWYCNDFSIGIEIEHRDNAPPYPQTQMDALTWLARQLIAAYAIPRSGCATHRTVARNAGRTDKYDPTDWDESGFVLWADSLYVTDRLKARTLPGVPGAPPVYCSQAAANFYNARGGLTFCGYPLRDEFHDAVLDCDVLPCERIAIKESANFGVEQALLSEAKARGWL